MPQSEERTNKVNAYADSLKIVWVFMAGLAFVALVLSTWTQGLSLDEELHYGQGFRLQEKQSD